MWVVGPFLSFAAAPRRLPLTCCSLTQGFIGFTLLSEMPSFLTDELNFSLSSAGIMSSFPYLGLFIVTLSFGKLGIHMQTAWGWEVDTVRQIANWTAFVGAGGGLLIAGYLADPYAAYAFVIISQSLLGKCALTVCLFLGCCGAPVIGGRQGLIKADASKAPHGQSPVVGRTPCVCWQALALVLRR